MKLLKNKIFIAVIMCLTVLAGAFYFVAPTNKVSADDAYVLTVQKVDLETDEKGELKYNNSGKAIERTEVDDGYQHQKLTYADKKLNVAMLLNSEPIVVDTDGDENTIIDRTYYRQYIKVSFVPDVEDGLTLQFLEVNATLNGIAIDTKEVTGETSTDDHSYTQYYDLTDIRLLREQTVVPIEEAQGLFKFTFAYMSKAQDGTTSPKQTAQAEFYVLNQDSYINKDDAKNIVEPRVANTENIDRDKVASQYTGAENLYANIYSFFNYNNATTVDYFGNKNSLDKIYYPTITYDPTKYYASYTKLLYGETETATTVYDPTNKQVVLTKTANNISTTKRYDITTDENNNFYVEIPLYDIGNYHISFDFVRQQYRTNNYEQLNTKVLNTDGKIDKSAITSIVSENWDRMGDVELSIYGYQLYHTVYKNVNGASESELTDHTDLFADVTNANITNSTNKLNNYVDTDGNKLIISTNQAPLFFKYNGSIVANGIKTESFYNLYTDSSKNNFVKVDGVEQQKVQIDSNTRFTENGYYEVYVVYTYNGYKYWNDDNGAVLDGDKLEKIQKFAFTIENIDPELKLVQVDDEGKESEFTANGFTNKNVKLTWDGNNQFNVLPEIRLESQNFNNDAPVDITSTYKTQINNHEVILTKTNKYFITINYGPCTYNQQTGKFDYSASVLYQFIIDKDPIEDISIKQVEIGVGKDENGQKTEFFYLSNTINSTSTNKDFVVSYGQILSEYYRTGKKESGAKITATYTQLLFGEVSNLQNYNYLIENNGKIYIKNGYEVVSSNDDLNYSQITKVISIQSQESDKTIDSAIDENEISSILTESGIYIFKFVDQAGNEATYTIILDKTQPVLLKTNEYDNDNNPVYTVLKGENNIVTIDTTVVWGDYKAITINSNFLNNIKDTEIEQVLVNINENYYYSTNIKNVTVKFSDDFNAVTGTGITFYADNKQSYFNGGKTYTIVVNDNLGNSNDLTKLEMNFDKSQLMAYIDGEAINNIQTIDKTTLYTSEQIENQSSTTQRLYPNSATNRQHIYVTWLANEGTDYEIDSIVCEFYPLTFEQDSTNYPYSSTSTQTFNLTNNTTYVTIDGLEGQRVRSAVINVVQDERYNSTATMPGMYKVIRKYKTQLPKGDSEVSDITIREYYFYVDRQNIISYFNNNILIGENIKIDMQDGSKTFSGSQFLQEFVNDYVLETNKLPVQTFVPETKYTDKIVSAVTPIRLYYLVTDEFNKIVYDSTDNTYKNEFIADGIYTVTIYDSTHSYEASDTKFLKNIDGTNKLIFKFKINNSAPQVIIIDQDNLQTTNDAFNTNKVKIGWKEDANGYMANIDTKNLTVTKLLPSGASQVIYKLANGIVTTGTIKYNIINKIENNANWQYEIDLSVFNITEDCKLQITVQYEGEQSYYKDKFTTTQNIYFDYTAPEYNYQQLLSQDKFLSNTEKSNFGDINSDINFENYAFMIDENFKIADAPKDSFWKEIDGHNANDTFYAWYRKYDKYSDENDALTMQSIVPTDPRYSDLSQAPQRLRFNENLKDADGIEYYKVISDRSTPFYQVVNNQPGYYEIIEEDIAGNYRVYTVAIYPSNSFENTLSFGYRNVKNNVTYTQVDWQTEDSIKYYYNINSENIEITNINLYLQSTTVGNNWFDVQLTSNKNGTISTANYRTSPVAVNNLLTIDQLIDSINEFIHYDSSVKNNGYSFGMIFRCSNGKTFTVNYKTPGAEPTVEFTGSQTNLTVTFVQDPNASVYLTEFYVFEAQNYLEDENGKPVIENRIEKDNNNKSITNPKTPNAGENAETISYTFRNTTGTGRNLVFVYVDNFGVEYKTFKIIGLTDVDYDNMIVIDGAYDKNILTDENGNDYYEYYTNQITKLNYQSAIYSIKYIFVTNYTNPFDITIDELDLEDLSSVTLSNGTKLLNLYNQRLTNAHYKYEILLTDTLGTEYKFVVNYYSKLADLEFMDSSNRLHNMDLESVTTKALYLTFDKNQYTFETFVSITKSYTNEYGEYFEETYNAQSGIMLTEGAEYIITKYNKFGDSYTYTFTIRKSAATHFYSVLVSPDGINLQEILPSDVKYNYNGSYIEQYFTVYDAIVEVSSNDNLVCDEISTIEHSDNSFTKIYHIYTDDVANITYDKYIAVTKIAYTRNILSNKFTINENQITNQKLITVTTDKVVITMPAYNQAPGNQVQVQLYYNSQYIGYLQDYVVSNDGTTMSFELNHSGIYTLYVSDLAGNTHWFNDSSYFTLYVLNNVLYKLNGNYGITNSVFNTNVTLTFDETQTLFTRQDVSGSNYKTYIAITSTLNGRPYTPTRNGDRYIYSAYGTYIITLSGIINNDTENPIVTTVKFSIINQNEAKVAHEYIGLNGYEVTSIVKNGVDITDDIREKLNMLTLNSFAISGGTNSVGGNGHYEITVKVNYNSIIPTQYFTYKVWINNDTEALILCSLEEGGSTTGEIQIQLNLYQIYSKIGECSVKINGNTYITINENTASRNQISTYKLTNNLRYNITLETNSGNTLLSFVVTKVEPLNTIAIIVIVVASLVVVGLTVTFILLRKKMKIR